MWQPPQARLVKMIEMRVGQQNSVNRRQILDPQPGPLDALEQKEPIRKVRVNKQVQIRELNKERCVPDPGQRHLPVREPRKFRHTLRPKPARQNGLPYHLPKESARVEMARRRQLFKRSRKPLPLHRRPIWRLCHFLHQNTLCRIEP